MWPKKVVKKGKTSFIGQGILCDFNNDNGLWISKINYFILYNFSYNKSYYYNNDFRQEVTVNGGTRENATEFLPIVLAICSAVLVTIIIVVAVSCTYIHRRKGKLQLIKHLRIIVMLCAFDCIMFFLF